MADASWYQVHPAFGCRPLVPADEPRPALVGEDELSGFWDALEDDGQQAVEFRFFDECLTRAVAPGGRAMVRGTLVLLPDYEFHQLDDEPLDDVRTLMFTSADEWFEVTVDGEPRLVVACGWQSTAARLTADDVAALPAWAPGGAWSSTPPDTEMDREEAARIAEDHLARLRALRWRQAIDRAPVRHEVVGAAGAVYTVAEDVVWDNAIFGRWRRRGDATVQVTVHDGGLSMAFPVIRTSTIPPGP